MITTDVPLAPGHECEMEFIKSDSQFVIMNFDADPTPFMPQVTKTIDAKTYYILLLGFSRSKFTG